ncbi:MAG TPA: hypothetical protein VM532_09820, partial [Burkholderiales bacterium]|nr:hypothetical protein [Burkholderiales bacterium]
EARNSNEIFSAVKQYAFWLSKTYDRSRDAIAILEELQDIAPDQEITRALAEVRLKARVLEGGELGSITTDEQQTDFAQALDAGNKRIHAEAKNIDFGAFSNLFHFSGNRIYVGRYGCNGCSDNGASISVLDRDTFEQAASIPVAPDDSDFQDAIRSIASDNDRIYASIEYRYEEAGRPNFVVIDKASHKILKKAQIDAPSSLIVENGALMACRCSSMSSFEQSCKVLDPITTKVIDAPDKICVHSSKIDGDAIIQFPIDEANTNLFVALTKDYVIAHRDWPEKKSRYTLFTRATHSQAAPVELNLQDSLDWPIAISGNSILISGATRDGMLIKLVSIPTGATKTLLGLPTTRSPIPVPLLLNQILFVGLGRDLMVFDVKNNRLQRYIKNFIPAPFKDNGNGLDANRIDRLLVDRGRLIAITFHGENSQVVPISELVASGE